MNFKMLKGGAHPHITKIKKESHKQRCYFYLSIEKIEGLLENFNEEHNILNYRFMFDLPFKSVSHAEREFIRNFKNEVQKTGNTVISLINYNEGFLNSNGILLINPEVIRVMPKGIRQYLLSKEYFSIGLELFKKYIFEHFTAHLKRILPHLKRKNGTAEV